jgi:hypothetical protein
MAHHSARNGARCITDDNLELYAMDRQADAAPVKHLLGVQSGPVAQMAAKGVRIHAKGWYRYF